QEADVFRCTFHTASYPCGYWPARVEGRWSCCSPKLVRLDADQVSNRVQDLCLALLEGLCPHGPHLLALRRVDAHHRLADSHHGVFVHGLDKGGYALSLGLAGADD